MSFFGFDTTLDRGGAHKLGQDEDLAVYTFGEEGYDDLAAQLDEGLDELNDETFGDSGTLAKDFDYVGNTVSHGDVVPPPPQHVQQQYALPSSQKAPSRDTLPKPTEPAPSAATSSVWASLPPARPAADRAGSSAFSAAPAQYASTPAALPPSNGRQSGRVLTLEEVEAEQRAAAQAARLARASAAGVAQESPRPSPSLAAAGIARLDSGTPGHGYSPAMPQAIPTSSDLDILRLAQSQNQQAQARQMFTQQHQQRQQELFDLQQQQQQQQHQQLHQLPPPAQMRVSPSIPPDFQRQQQQQMGHRSQGSYSSPRLGMQPPIPMPPQHQHQNQHQHQQLHSHTPQPSMALSQQALQGMAPNELMARLQIMESLTGTSPVLMDQVNHLSGGDPAMAHLGQLPQKDRELLMAEAMNKIHQAEAMEEKRRRRMQKIAHMSKYNDIMTQSDKDFITRIQVSQLVTQDPYAEDFYAQVFSTINNSRIGANVARGGGHQKVLSFGDGVGVGVVATQERRSGRRENALNRMQTQIERIVSNAKKREPSSPANLQGALGKISGRSYKAAPRQLLQVESSAEAREDAAKAAAKEGLEALAGAATGQVVPQQPLTRTQALVIIEHLYDILLDVEQMRRDQPRQDNDEAMAEWMDKYNALSDKLWLESKIMVALETSTPHPFISVLEPSKGKRILPRLLRHVDLKRSTLFLTLLVACYKQLDVVRMSPLLDLPEQSAAKREAETQTELFATTVMPAVESILRRVPTRFVTGLLGLFLEGGEILPLARTQPGAILLTLILNRVTDLKAMASVEDQPIEQSDLEQWQLMVEHLGQFIFGSLTSLFPSTRLALHLPPGITYYQRLPLEVELNDTVTWQFLANFAINTTPQQQQLLVAELREKILDNVASVQKGWIQNEGLAEAKMRNVNIFLNALGLDASQITL